jgi:hypothetical protein
VQVGAYASFKKLPSGNLEKHLINKLLKIGNNSAHDALASRHHINEIIFYHNK